MKRSLSLVEAVVIVATAILFTMAIIALLVDFHPVVVGICAMAAVALMLLLFIVNRRDQRELKKNIKGKRKDVV